MFYLPFELIENCRIAGNWKNWFKETKFLNLKKKLV